MKTIKEVISKKQNIKKPVIKVVTDNQENKEMKSHNYGLFKYLGGLLLITALLTWIFKVNVGGETQFIRIGVIDFFTMIIISLQFYAVKVSFLLILGGFYEILSFNKGYKTIIGKITKLLKGNEKLFVIATMLIFSVLSAIIIDPFVLLIFVPFVIAIIIGLKHDNLTAFLATFGGILVGTIGNIYGSTNFGFFMGENLATLNVAYGSGIAYRIGLLAGSFILLTVFTVLHMNKKNKKNEEIESKNIFESQEEVAEGKTWPTAVVLSILAVIAVIAFMPWGAFGASWQTNLNTWFNKLAIGGESIFQYIVGYVPEFGAWDLIIIQSVLLMTSLVIAKLSKMSFKTTLNAFGYGFKKMLKPIVLVILIGAIALIPLNIQIFQTMFAKMMPTFNYLFTPVIAFISSIFGVEMQYAWVLGGANIAASFTGSFNGGTLAVIFQSVYGLVQFIAPTSIFLIIGLSYLDIPYTTWLKKSWMYLLGLLIAVIAVVILITQL